MKDGIAKLQFDDDFLLESAERRYGNGDYFGALTLLNKREELHEPLADAYALAADVYEALELWQNAADAWFRFLDTCNEADFEEGYEGLAVAFMNLGNLQPSYYYRLCCGDEGLEGFTEEDLLELGEPPRPPLRLVYAKGMPVHDSESLAQGLALLKTGEIEAAREIFRGVDEDSADFPSAAGLGAMCSLLLGEDEKAEAECAALIGQYPDNVQILTSYCAVLDARDNREGAKEVAKRLAALSVDATEDLYRIATALCETGMDEEAYEKLAVLKERLPFDKDVLWFHAVSAVHTAHIDEAVDSLETLTTLFPRKAVARLYLENLRRMRDGGDKVTIGYYYRMPEEKYRAVAAFFLEINAYSEENGEAAAGAPAFKENFFLAFDEMEGRDEKLQLLAAKVAVKCRADACLRDVLLNCEGDEAVKLAILHDLITRNEDNSFGTVICNLYKEFFIHELELGRRKSGALLQAFADVYAKYALRGEDHEAKLCAAAEEVYAALSESGAWSLFDDRNALSAAIYREARLSRGERSFSEICRMFGADEGSAKRILNYMM